MAESVLTLEAATVIRVPPPGLDPGYIVAVVRTPEGLRTGRLLCSPDDLPVPGSGVELAASHMEGIAAYRPVAI
jgi:hypothetical protein